MTSGGGQAAQTFEKAQDGTLYWTLSLYIAPERVAAAAGRKGQPIGHRLFDRVQRAHAPSQALRDAIDPLFNDIADREVLGEVQEMLLAAIDTPEGSDAKAVGKAIRAPEELTFHPPTEICWTTEGVTYRASPPGLADDRAVRFRRFWFAHNNGALSYHMSFSHHYAAHPGEGGGYGPATLYFLSLLQKLAAPKEFALKPERRNQAAAATVLEPDLGVAPFDALELTDAQGMRTTFWRFVEGRLIADAERLFARLARADAPASGSPVDGPKASPLRWRDLIEEVSFIEVPGLTIPKSRFMFVVHDERFFKRLMPLDPITGDTVARKLMVQELCYAPYQQALEARVEAAETGDGVVQLDEGYWNWATTRPDYDAAIRGRKPALRKPGGGNFRTVTDLATAMHKGEVELTLDANGAPLLTPRRLQLPAFEPMRPDCLDYLFLAGFNQNIIDFMNQDTSEILDSIDPIYPDSDEQSDERFFVRYANHRAMITYVPKSRSLETGNDYIGTCPYAFLIHVMSLHNEYLAREHEAKSMARIERIDWLVTPKGDRTPLSAAARALDTDESLRGADDYDRAELAINQAKLAEYRDYERFRYANPFRYDTERDVFTKLEELRGVTRKKNALALAIESLEDHASDLQRRHEQQADRAAARRETQLSILLGGTGVFGAGQMMYWIGDDMMKSGATETLSLLGLHDLSISGVAIVDWTKAVMYCALIFFVPFFFYVLGTALRDWLKPKWQNWCTRQDSNLWPPD